MNGIYTLGNDNVFDQIVALLNSIEANLGTDIPVIICPYDNHLDRLQAEVENRPQVEIFSDQEVIQTWDTFAHNIWDLHPFTQSRLNQGQSRYHRFGTHRRFCGFDGPFEKFLYIDADTLILNTIDSLLQPLDQGWDWIVYDFQYKDPSHVYAIDSEKLSQVFAPERIEQEIFCSGMYATRRGIFDAQRRQMLLECLAAGDVDVLYPMAPDQTLLNYMVMKSGLRVYNQSRQLPSTEITGCCVTSSHFEVRDRLACDHQKRLTYLHYIGLPMQLFERVCQGENLDFPYRDLFLDYRYWHEPQARPVFTGPAKPYNAQLPIWQRALRKVGLSFNYFN
jgi:hypothetical protein